MQQAQRLSTEPDATVVESCSRRNASTRAAARIARSNNYRLERLQIRVQDELARQEDFMYAAARVYSCCLGLLTVTDSHARASLQNHSYRTDSSDLAGYFRRRFGGGDDCRSLFTGSPTSAPSVGPNTAVADRLSSLWTPSSSRKSFRKIWSSRCVCRSTKQ